MNFYKILNNLNRVNSQNLRRYAFKSDLKIKWVRPEKIPCYKPEKSGDCSKLPPVDVDQYMLGFEKSGELKSADPQVQQLFQLANNRNVHTSKYYKEMLVKEVQRHSRDYFSMESRIAWMTATIRRHQEIMEQYPRNVGIKVQLKELIDKRKKFLKYLRRWDYKRFEWLLEKLDLIYKPPPNEFHWITRKDSLRKLTDLYCENIKDQRLKDYQASLETKQIPFLEDAIKKMERMMQDQLEWDLKPRVTNEQIEGYKHLLKKLKDRETGTPDAKE